MLPSSTDAALLARCESLARLAGLGVAALGAAVLFGWALDIAVLKSVLPGLVTMKANTAAGFLLSGGSLAAAVRARTGAHWRDVHRILAAAVTLLGLLTLGEYLLAADFGIDEFLFSANPEPGSTAPFGRISVATAAGFSLTGVALTLLDSRRGRAWSQAAAFSGAGVGVLAAVGYAYNAAGLDGVGGYSSLSLHAALGFVVINIGMLLARPRRGLMAIVTSKTAGGVMARRLLPLALAIPLLIGWLLVRGEQRGLYSSEFGITLVALAFIALSAALIWRTAGVLHRSDQCRFAAEGARQRQQAQLNGIIDSAMDGIIMVDAAQRIVLFNPAAEQIFGRSAADTLGAPLDVLLPERTRSTHHKHIRSFGASGVTNRPLGMPGSVTGLRANGEEFPIEASISRLEANGKMYFTVVLRDFSERKRVQEALREREAHLKLAMEVAKIGTWERNLVTGAGSWSSETKAMIGLDTDTYTFEDFIRHIHPEDLPRMREALAAPVSAVPFEHEYRIVRPCGEVRWVNERGQAVFDGNGKPVWALGAVLDITERRAMEDELRASKAEAERANNAKSRFLAAASHDLRQPLSALSLYVNVLRSHVAPASQPLLSNLNDCVGSLSELLNNLLDLSKLEAGAVTPNPANFAVADALTSLQSVHAPEAQLKGLELRCVSSALTAHTDPVLFRRILGNLIANAIRYTNSGGVLVACRRRLGRMWIEVWDTGIGVPADKTAEIFEEFRQLGDEARTRGSGLGLAIVAKTAALLGLEIRMRSRVGRGSVFAIELPLGHEQAIIGREPSEAGYASLRIALIEDNPLVLEALAGALENAGHQVLAAASGEEVCAQLARLPPDVVVSDYRLAQGETGFDVITAVRAAMGVELPAILITGDTDPKLMRSMADRGIAVLHKPVDLETLQAYMEDLLHCGEAVEC